MWNASHFDPPSEDRSRNQGGFMQQETNSFDSPSSQKKTVRRAQNVVPLVIRQIKSCEEEDFKLFGMHVQIATIVGILHSLDVQSIKAKCIIEDHTGDIEAVLWLPNEEDAKTSMIAQLKLDHYVRVSASIRNEQDKKVLMILKIEPVNSPNVLTTHLLEVIHTRLGAEASSLRGPSVNAPGATLANAMSVMETEQTTPNASSVNSKATGFKPLQDKVYKVLKTAVNSDTGLHINAILKNFSRAQESEVREALHFLLNDGHAYTTLDTDHYMITD